jgi:RNA polymerase sigma factor (sigma-70 family)
VKLTDEQRNLVESNLGIARLAAHDLKDRCKACGLPLEDAISEGYLALCDAAQKSKPERGFKFTTYAYAVARSRILRACGQNNVIRPPHNISERRGYTHVRPLSLDAIVSSSGTATICLGDTVPDPHANVEAEVIDRDTDWWFSKPLIPSQRRTLRLLMSGYRPFHIAHKDGVSYQAIQSRIQSLGSRINPKLREVIG